MTMRRCCFLMAVIVAFALLSFDNSPRYTFLGPQEGSTFAQQWYKKSNALNASRILIQTTSNQTMDIALLRMQDCTIEADNLLECAANSSSLENIDWIQREGVLWMRPKIQMKTLNKYASGVVQSSHWDQTPMWEHELRGEGQIIAIGDTGLGGNSLYISSRVRAFVNTMPFNQIWTCVSLLTLPLVARFPGLNSGIHIERSCITR